MWKVCEKGTLKQIGSVEDLTDLVGGLPQFYITGDGHRDPPFKWAVESGLKPHFAELAEKGKLVAYVEEFQKNVSVNSVPASLKSLALSGRVIGFEPDVWRVLEPEMQILQNQAVELMSTAKNLSDTVSKAHGAIKRVVQCAGQLGNPGFILDIQEYVKVFDLYVGKVAPSGLSSMFTKAEKRDSNREMSHGKTLAKFNNQLMNLRTTIGNQQMAAELLKGFVKYSDSVHIVSIGKHHIDNNPIQNLLAIPKDAVGVVDPDDGKS